MSDTLYLLVQYAAEGKQETANEIACIDGVGRVSRVRGAYDLIVRVDEDGTDAPTHGVSDAVLALPGVLHVVPVHVPDFLRAE
jgi:hypothetical protein